MKSKDAAKSRASKLKKPHKTFADYSELQSGFRFLKDRKKKEKSEVGPLLGALAKRVAGPKSRHSSMKSSVSRRKMQSKLHQTQN